MRRDDRVRPLDGAGAAREVVRQTLAGHRLVLAGQWPGSLLAAVRRLRALGAAPPLVVTAARCAPAALRAEAQCFCAGIEAICLDDSITQLSAILDDPPAELARTLEAFDPERRALVLDSPCAGTAEVGERRRYGWRRPEWAIWEDKVVVADLWASAGIPAAPHAVLRADSPALADAARRLDDGLGTVWACDASGGFTSGAAGLRRVHGDADATEAQGSLAARSRRLRVMPFLEGTPCSVHAIVLPEGTAVLRPIEIVTLRRPGPAGLTFAGTSTFWDPPPDAWTDVRTAGVKVADELRARSAYRGALTLDGILTDDGFRPTEVNARLGSGLDADNTVRELPLYLLDRVVREGDAGALDADALERTVLHALDLNRVGALELPAPDGAPPLPAVGIVPTKGEWRPVAVGEPAQLEFREAPARLRRQLTITCGPAFPHGALLGPRAARALRWYSAWAGVEFGEYESPQV